MSTAMIWVGRVVSAIPVLMLSLSASMKLTRSAAAVEGFTHLGWPDSLSFGLGIVELTCTILYVIPRTAVLGAILLTGYLGGATATHLRIGEPVYMAVLLGVLVWAGLWLREGRLRALIPLRS